MSFTLFPCSRAATSRASSNVSLCASGAEVEQAAQRCFADVRITRNSRALCREQDFVLMITPPKPCVAMYCPDFLESIPQTWLIPLPALPRTPLVIAKKLLRHAGVSQQSMLSVDSRPTGSPFKRKKNTWPVSESLDETGDICILVVSCGVVLDPYGTVA